MSLAGGYTVGNGGELVERQAGEVWLDADLQPTEDEGGPYSIEYVSGLFHSEERPEVVCRTLARFTSYWGRTEEGWLRCSTAVSWLQWQAANGWRKHGYIDDLKQLLAEEMQRHERLLIEKVQRDAAGKVD